MYKNIYISSAIYENVPMLIIFSFTDGTRNNLSSLSQTSLSTLLQQKLILYNITNTFVKYPISAHYPIKN